MAAWDIRNHREQADVSTVTEYQKYQNWDKLKADIVKVKECIVI